MRHPAAEEPAAAAALRVPTNATSEAPAVSRGATALSSRSPSPSYVAPSHSANSRTRMQLMITPVNWRARRPHSPYASAIAVYPANHSQLRSSSWRPNWEGTTNETYDIRTWPLLACSALDRRGTRPGRSHEIDRVVCLRE